MQNTNTASEMVKKTALTKRQQLNVRTELAKVAGKVGTRLALFAAGEKDKHGEKIEMTMGEIRAAEILLRKTVPDLQATVEVAEDDFGNLSRNELESRLRDVVKNRPGLAQMSGIDRLVNDAKTVIEIKTIDDN